MFYKQQVLERNAIFLLRIWTGVIFIRYGFSVWNQASMNDFADTLQNVNIPFPFFSAYVCKATEFFGGIFLVIGFQKKFACIFLLINMAVATFVFHKGLLFQDGRTTFLLLICCLTIFFSTTDQLSISRFINNHTKRNTL